MKQRSVVLVLFAALLTFGQTVKAQLQDDGRISGLKEITAVGISALKELPKVANSAPAAFAELRAYSVAQWVALLADLRELPQFQELAVPQLAEWLAIGIDQLVLFDRAFALASGTPPKLNIASDIYLHLAVIRAGQISLGTPEELHGEQFLSDESLSLPL